MRSTIEVIAEPRRREILRLVWDTELSVNALVSQLDVSQPAVSQHLRVLREAGLVSVRRDGTRRLYRSRPEALGELRAYMEAYWHDGLARLKREAELEERKGDARGG
jgi:DNA-binding transcriptional ArsR family regulator